MLRIPRKISRSIRTNPARHRQYFLTVLLASFLLFSSLLLFSKTLYPLPITNTSTPFTMGWPPAP